MYQGFNGFGYPAGTNPMQPQMDRLNYMQQQYNQQMNQNQPQQAQQPQQIIIPVASVEEVRSHPVDWSGNTSYFIDNVNKRIYTKQLNLSGVPEVNTYVLNNDVLKSETNSTIAVDNELLERIKVLENKINNYEMMFLGGMSKNDESNANTKSNE